jgi:quercetin dioxygenase-like cupin family protein
MIMPKAMDPRPLGWEQIADCGAMRMVGLRLAAGQRVPEHRNALPVAVIVTEGSFITAKARGQGAARAGELILINPGERHTYWAQDETAAYMVFAGLPGVRARPWTLKQR